MSSGKVIKYASTFTTSRLSDLADARNENTKLDEQAGLLQLYQNWARETGRHYDQAIILLVGHSGHGKSKTINRLIGHNLLQVGRMDKLGSTTKAVQRVKMPVPASNIEPAVTLALDDTPGYADNTYDDRGANLALIKIYQELYFSESAGLQWRRYPNIILLVTSWNTITVDAYNAPECFTSPVGQSMFKLSHAGLVDLRRTNVIVVVTKSLSFMSEFDDYKTQQEKHEQWNIEAGRRKGIITDLQRKVFPKSIPWPIIFIENGGGQQVHHRYPTLPNGELSHQNLFDAIRGVIEQKGPKGASDLAGVQALQLITGAKTLRSVVPGTKRDSHRQYGGKYTDSDISWTKPPCSGRSRELADQFLGVTYDPISGSYGRTCVLELGPSEVGFRKGSGAETYFTQADDVQEENTAVATRLRCDFDVPNLARLSAHYSTSDSVKHARNSGSHMYVAQHLMEEAAFTSLVRYVEAAIQRFLPHSWNTCCATSGIRRKYTHCGEKIARILEEHTRVRQVQVKTDLPAISGLGAEVGMAATRESERAAKDTMGRRDIRIFVDGGGSVARELTGKLEDHFKSLPLGRSEEYSWPDPEIRTKWTKALEGDPAFCPDHTSTEFCWLHTLGGLSADQQQSLRMASESYLKTRHERKAETSQPHSGERKPVKDLPRKSNLAQVEGILKSLLFWRK
ncbi:hypothetical protein B0H14DRAFT_2560968 [Mycena olivaceomarginata]|nr:hypothetical protein B0H14DRAFT_2560968 [Mycena olivaceomarginata]